MGFKELGMNVTFLSSLRLVTATTVVTTVFMSAVLVVVASEQGSLQTLQVTPPAHPKGLLHSICGPGETQVQ